jgi:hypothetical protein
MASRSLVQEFPVMAAFARPSPAVPDSRRVPNGWQEISRAFRPGSGESGRRTALATGTLALPPVVIEGLEEFKGSFDRLCLQAGTAVIEAMLAADTDQLCGKRYQRHAGRARPSLGHDRQRGCLPGLGSIQATPGS